MNSEQVIRNILSNILVDIERTERTRPELSMVVCEIDKELIEVAKQYLREGNE